MQCLMGDSQHRHCGLDPQSRGEGLGHRPLVIAASLTVIPA